MNIIPSVVHQLVNSTKNVDLSSLVGILSGAAYLPDDLAKRLAHLGPKNMIMTIGYGMSETTVGACALPFPGILDGRAKSTPGSTGILIPGMEARIRREDGSDADLNEPGELWLKGDNIALGYWNDEKANRETFVDGWLRTGDMFSADANESLYFRDRAKDILKVSGMQVSPAEIENVLLEHPDRLVIDATVAGIPGGRTSDEKIPRAWVVLSELGAHKGKAASVEALDAWIRTKLSKYKWLRGGIEVVDQIPKSPTGKVLRRVLQDGYEQRTSNPGPKL